MNCIAFIFLMVIVRESVTQNYETDFNFRVEPGSRACFFETGMSKQVLEVQYQVIDGHHGVLDITFEIMDPNGVKIVSDHKKSENSIIMDLELDGEYVFCMDNTFSVMNSKLVFVYIGLEDKKDVEVEAVVSVTEENEVVEWSGTTLEGEVYYIEVAKIVKSLTRTLKYVVKARHLLNVYSASKTRDNYLAHEDIFIVDVWSLFQIAFMLTVGMIQVYMIKKLFTGCDRRMFDYY